MKYFNILIVAFLIQSCVDVPYWPSKIYARIYNQSGKNLILKTNPANSTSDIFEFPILKNDSIEIKLEARRNGMPFYSDSIYVYFSDNKKLVFKNYDNVPENYLKTRILAEKETKGKYKNDRIYKYYIKPIHYDLAR